MKKRDRKLQLNRETVRRLDREALVEVQGGVIAPVEDTGRWSSCGAPDCCPETQAY
jgi:hypothetical protein